MSKLPSPPHIFPLFGNIMIPALLPWRKRALWQYVRVKIRIHVVGIFYILHVANIEKTKPHLQSPVFTVFFILGTHIATYEVWDYYQ